LAILIIALTVATPLTLLAFAACGAAQTENPYRMHVESNQLQAPIRVESNMVIAPTFVFNKKGIGYSPPRELQCIKADTAAFNKLSPSESHLPTDCYRANISDLTASNFHLFEDGVEERIQAVVPERWGIVIRDNATSPANCQYGANGARMLLTKAELTPWIWCSGPAPRNPHPRPSSRRSRPWRTGNV
jgi:hypothetical protein